MGRIEKRFARLKADKRAGLVAYFSDGDPDFATSYQILKGLPAAGRVQGEKGPRQAQDRGGQPEPPQVRPQQVPGQSEFAIPGEIQ